MKTALSAVRTAESSNLSTAGQHGKSSLAAFRTIIQANLAIAPSNPEYRLRHGGRPTIRIRRRAPAGGRAPRGGRGGNVSFYKTTDGGEHWALATDDTRVFETGSTGRHPPDNRPLGRIGGGDLPTITVDPKNEKVVYSCSTVFWRTEDAGLTWSAVRGAPGRRRLSEELDQPR